MKYQKVITGASLVGLITFLLPVVSGGGYSPAPISDTVVSYLGVPSVFVLFILWYGAFAITLFLSLTSSKTANFSKVKSVLVVILNVYAIFVHVSITGKLVGNSGSLGFGGILYYLSAIVSLFASIMLFKENGLKITKEDIEKVAEKGVTIGKATASVVTKVAKTTVSEVKKQIDDHKSNSGQQ